MSSPEADEREELSPRRCSASTGIECPLPSYEEVVSGAASSLYKPRVDSVYEAHFNRRNHPDDPGPDKKAMAVVLLALILIPMCALIITIQVKVCNVIPSNGTLGYPSINRARSSHAACENELRDWLIQVEGFQNEKKELISKILELQKEVQSLSAYKDHLRDLPRLENWNQIKRLLNSIGDDGVQNIRTEGDSSEV